MKHIQSLLNDDQFECFQLDPSMCETGECACKIELQRRAKVELNAMLDALTWYAKPRIYETGAIDLDEGHRARTTLKSLVA
jgi:hypothetical protein